VKSERRGVVITHGGDARLLFETFSQTPAEVVRLLRTIVRSRKIECSKSYTIRREPWIECTGRLKAFQEQSCADKGDECQRHFRNHDEPAQAMPVNAREATAAALV